MVTSRHTAAIWPSSIQVSVTTSVNEPPSRYSIITCTSNHTVHYTMHTLGKYHTRSFNRVTVKLGKVLCPTQDITSHFRNMSFHTYDCTDTIIPFMYRFICIFAYNLGTSFMNDCAKIFRAATGCPRDGFRCKNLVVLGSGPENWYFCLRQHWLMRNGWYWAATQH